MAAPLISRLLHQFSTPRSVKEVARDIPYSLDSIEREVRKLERLGFLLPATGRKPLAGVAARWAEAFPAAYYHFARRDYFPTIGASGRPVSTTSHKLPLPKGPSPSHFKEYRGAPQISLWREGSAHSHPQMSLEEALRERRSVRRFSRRPVTFADFATIIHGTWGQMGWVDGGSYGRLIKKTSPSVGGRNPIECYVLAWNVEGLLPGLYHYSVRRNALERLRRGDFRREAVLAAVGQKHVGKAAFLCVMTAVTRRMFWKYATADAYRNFFFDVGHLDQTFALLATAHGLGPFATGALYESRLEKLLGIDGVAEFPIFLCGAGSKVR